MNVHFVILFTIFKKALKARHFFNLNLNFQVRRDTSFRTSYFALPRREPSRRIQALAAAKNGANENPDLEKNMFKTEYELPKKEKYKETVDDRLTGAVSLQLEEESLDILHSFRFIDEECKYDPKVDLTSCDLDSFRRNLACLQMVGPHKVTTKRIQSLCIHPTISKQIVLAGSANGSLGLWDINADRENDVAEFSYHKAPLNCVSVSNFNHCKIYTTSHDGTVCCVDMENQLSTNIFSTDFGSRIKHLTWHEEISANSLLISHGDGSVGILDVREDTKKVSWINCFERSCRTVQLNPVNSDYFLACSGIGGCKIFDLRGSPKSACVTDISHPKGLTSAFFSPDGNQILTTCNDDRLRIFDCSSFVDNVPSQKKSIIHNNHTGRWLSVFKAAWFPNRNDVFHIGSLMSPRRYEGGGMNSVGLLGNWEHAGKCAKKRNIQFYENSGFLLYDLTHEEMLTISPVIAVHPKLPFIAGGNSSGKIHIFVPPENTATEREL
uniref:WD repeat-containing protein 76 n=1 Tax=Rhodnius prolixus TaxID=13249 RepID=T1HP05_RHOPR